MNIYEAVSCIDEILSSRLNKIKKLKSIADGLIKKDHKLMDFIHIINLINSTHEEILHFITFVQKYKSEFVETERYSDLICEMISEDYLGSPHSNSKTKFVFGEEHLESCSYGNSSTKCECFSDKDFVNYFVSKYPKHLASVAVKDKQNKDQNKYVCYTDKCTSCDPLNAYR